MLIITVRCAEQLGKRWKGKAVQPAPPRWGPDPNPPAASGNTAIRSEIAQLVPLPLSGRSISDTALNSV